MAAWLHWLQWLQIREATFMLQWGCNYTSKQCCAQAAPFSWHPCCLFPLILFAASRAPVLHTLTQRCNSPRFSGGENATTFPFAHIGSTGPKLFQLLYATTEMPGLVWFNTIPNLLQNKPIELSLNWLAERREYGCSISNSSPLHLAPRY